MEIGVQTLSWVFGLFNYSNFWFADLCDNVFFSLCNWESAKKQMRSTRTYQMFSLLCKKQTISTVDFT